MMLSTKISLLVVSGLVVLFFLSCTREFEPEPIYHSKDTCAHCKMVISDARFGAEIITAKGKIYKFDSLECMKGFSIKNQSLIGIDSVKFVAHSFEKSELLPVQKAYFAESSEIHSPMGKGYLSAESEEKLKTSIGKSTQIKVIRWPELEKLL